ncbi:InlB B-repeat-containing protein [Mycoplasma phocimorsus]|uniref:InlB B-repeat-containing protein n=1 Tax=Mycoplasma phocimorsus TaxID=3045839 RepID=UPI0024C03A97|nr:InlB B-repeat-containing protein [Mycoplasma phocimorsus]MDJ1646749.1 InlB B-repeat-containing protein [Mycoplasma phocimorsus]
MKKKQFLFALSVSALTLSTFFVSCNNKIKGQHNSDSRLENNSSRTEIENYIASTIRLNTEDITVYDALGGITNLQLKIVNEKEFKEKGIRLGFSKQVIDYEKEQLVVQITYRQNGKIGKNPITFNIPFANFKWIDGNDWSRIFAGLTKYTKIELHGKNADGKWNIKIKNAFGKAAEIVQSPYKGEIPSVDRISYRLTVTNSSKVTGNFEDTTSNYLLTGGTITRNDVINITIDDTNGNIKTIKSDEGVIQKPEDPKWKENHKFLGWSTQENATKPNIFINGEKEHKFVKPTTIYAVFAKYPTLLVKLPKLNYQKDTIKTLVLGENGEVTKERITKLIQDGIDSVKDANKWSFDSETLKYTDSSKNEYPFLFDEDGESIVKFEIGKEYTLNVNYMHEPVYIFKKQETDEFIGHIWANKIIDEEEILFTSPVFSIDLSKQEMKGQYLFKKFFLDGTEYKADKLFDLQNKDNEEIVELQFESTKQIKIESSTLESNKEVSDQFLTLDGRLKEAYLPKIDFSWYKGESPRKFDESDVQNNEAFDKRSKEEKEKGVVFAGWYSDPEFRNKIIFKDGLSKYPIKTNKIYPKFTADKWDKIRDIREIFEIIFEIAEKSASTAANFEGIKKYADITKDAISFVRWVTYLLMGGKRTSEEFWKGYESINRIVNKAFNWNGNGKDFLQFNGESFKGSSSVIVNSITKFIEEIAKAIVAINSTYGNGEFRDSVFTDKVKKWEFSKFLNSDENARKQRVEFVKVMVLNGLIENCNGTNNEENKSIKGKYLQKLKNDNSTWNKNSIDVWTALNINGENGKKSPHPYLVKLNEFAETIAGKGGIQDIMVTAYQLIKDSKKDRAFQIAKTTVKLAGDISSFITKLYTSLYVLLEKDKKGEEKKK